MNENLGNREIHTLKNFFCKLIFLISQLMFPNFLKREREKREIRLITIRMNSNFLNP